MKTNNVENASKHILDLHSEFDERNNSPN